MAIRAAQKRQFDDKGLLIPKGFFDAQTMQRISHWLDEPAKQPPRLFEAKVNYKLPGGRADKLHQDQTARWGRYTDFFDCYLPHGSPPNTSDRQRRNIIHLTFDRESADDLRERYYREKWALYLPNQQGEARSESSYRV